MAVSSTATRDLRDWRGGPGWHRRGSTPAAPVKDGPSGLKAGPVKPGFLKKVQGDMFWVPHRFPGPHGVDVVPIQGPWM